MSSIRPNTNGYNLRRRNQNRADSPAIPGGFAAPPPVPSRAASPDTTPLSSISTSGSAQAPGVGQGASSLRGHRTYSQVASRSGSPTQNPDLEKTAAHAQDGGQKAAHGARGSAAKLDPRRATVEEVTDDEAPNVAGAEGGTWTQTKNGKHTGTMGPKPLTREREYYARNVTNNELPRSENTGAARVAPVYDRAGPAEATRSPSRGEGMSKQQGKTIDPRNWGNSGIPPEELDPEAQRRAFRRFSYCTRGHC